MLQKKEWNIRTARRGKFESMTLSHLQHNGSLVLILRIVADLSQNNVKKDLLETEIISHSGLSAVEVRNYLGDLEWMNLAKEALPRPSHAEYRL
jgi:hypothetical protein